MCGINGILYFNKFNSDKPESYLEDHILKMNSEIAHRGPDGEGVMINYPVCFGHRRLSIIDLSKDAAQPMFNEDKSMVLVYNGEIYNYLELIPDLKKKGHVFKSKCDSEVVLHSFEEYGPDCVTKFNGMWAFAVYDFRKKVLFVSRDRFGVKPFYYYLDNHQFIFSSEIKSILKVKHITDSNHGKVYDYLAYGYRTNNGETFFKNINELKPAHNLLLKDGKPEFRKYWDFQKTEYTGDDPKDVFSTLIEDSVRLRFRSDVPVSILLSGGLDSGIITKVTDELITKDELNADNVTAFSAVFPDFKYDESSEINDVLNSVLHINGIRLTPTSDNLLDFIDEFVYGMGEPVFSTTSFAHFLLMKEIKKRKVKVVLNGQGADEAWCGYGKYIAGYFLKNALKRNPFNFLGELKSVSGNMDLGYKYLILQTVKSFLSRKKASYLRSKYQEKILPCLNGDFIKSNYDYFVNPVEVGYRTDDPDSYLKYNIQHQGFNQILHYEDHSSMQNSVEIRSPFIDYRIMELAFSVLPEMKYYKGITKKLLRDSFADKLPASIIKSRRKIGFVTPFEDWINEPGMKEFITSLLNSSSFSQKNIWDPVKIRSAFVNKKHDKGFPVWRIINLEIWSKLYKISNL